MRRCFNVIYIGRFSSTIEHLSKNLIDHDIKIIDVKRAKVSGHGAAIALIDRRRGRYQHETVVGLKPQSIVSLALVNEYELQRQSLFEEGFLDYIVWPPLKSELSVRLETAYKEAVRRGMGLYCADPLVEKACRVMIENISEPIRLEIITKKIGTSRTTLIEHFQRTFHCGPLAWLRNQRMEEAARLLAGKKQSITTIAAAVGYEDSNNFSTAFRSFYGVSPRHYRKNTLAT